MRGKYYLISKTTQKFTEYQGRAIRLTKSTPYSVDEVLIGNKKKAVKKITTFRDSSGKLIERIFNYKNKPLTNRIYTHNDYTIGQDEFVTSTTVKEFSLERSSEEVYKKLQEQLKMLNIQTTLWKRNKVQTNHTAENINNGNKILSIIKTDNINGTNQELHSFTEYPAIVNGKILKTKPKSLNFTVNTETQKVNKKSIKSQGIEIPKNDTFLGFRALDIEDAKEPMTEYFMKERKTDNLGYKINTNYVNPSEKLIAYFCDGQFLYNKLYKFKSKSQLASVSRHEVEHSWQFYLDARNGGKRGEYLEELGKQHGEITNKKLLKEAQRYTQSLDNYVPFEEDFKRYKKNYVEITADRKGNKAKIKYETEGEEIRNSFKHIPPETL